MAKQRRKADSRITTHSDLNRFELESKVCNLFCKGKSTTEILDILANENPPIVLRRQEPWEIIQRVAKEQHHLSGSLQFVPPVAHTLGRRLETGRQWLKDRVEVVHTADVEGIAYRAAGRLLDIMRDSARPDFHVGFAGGGLLEQTARILAAKLSAAEIDPNLLPRRLYFHAMIGRFGDDPGTDPNSFAAYFTREPLQMEVRFEGLMCPGMVSAENEAILRDMPGIKESYDKIDSLDVIVTSAGGHWDLGHSRLHAAYVEKDDKAALTWLKEQGCIGDLMWGPIAKSGAVPLANHTRAMTLIRLDQLSQLIQQRKKVMLILGPCVKCGKPKPEILDAVLNWSPPLITHLVVDSHTVHQLFRDYPTDWA
jgi:DNA-binding transcriptional regulator LsrR (DeoR family)